MISPRHLLPFPSLRGTMPRRTLGATGGAAADGPVLLLRGTRPLFATQQLVVTGNTLTEPFGPQIPSRTNPTKPSEAEMSQGEMRR